MCSASSAAAVDKMNLALHANRIQTNSSSVFITAKPVVVMLITFRDCFHFLTDKRI